MMRIVRLGGNSCWSFRHSETGNRKLFPAGGIRRRQHFLFHLSLGHNIPPGEPDFPEGGMINAVTAVFIIARSIKLATVMAIATSHLVTEKAHYRDAYTESRCQFSV